MKKIILLLVSILLLVVSCGSKKEASDKFEVGVTFYRFDDNFLAGMRNDMIDIQKEKYPNMELLLNDSQNSQPVLNDQVDTLISKGVKVLVINLVDPTAGQAIVDKAKAADIPVILYNKDPGINVLNSYDKAYYVGNNPEESGIFQGETIVKQWKANPALDLNGDGVIQYAMITGEPGHPDAEARTKFSISTIEKAGIKTEKVFEDTALWDTAQAKDKVDAWLSSPNGKNIEVIISNNDGMALGALESTKAHNVKLPIYGVDAIQEALLLIANDELAGTVLNDGLNQARAVLALANNLAQGKEATEGTEYKLVDKAVRVPYVGVDRENYKEFQK